MDDVDAPPNSPVHERYRRLSDAFAATVAAVPDDRWSAPTPCDDWDARALVGHVVQSHGMFQKLVEREPATGPDPADDPVGAFAAAQDRTQADLEDPERADAAFDGFMGRSTFADGIDRFICTDLVIHRWDLARATGGDQTLPDDEVARIDAEMRAMGDALRSPGAFGPELTPSEGADEATRLLCFLGRRP